MTKYIDAEKLKAEIERRRLQNRYIDTDGYEQELFEIIDSLQQEQQEVNLDADIEMEWDSFNKHIAEYGVESEEVVWLNWHSFNDVARHFAELGAEHAKK